ncbi:DUF1059 domain-containing protein [Geodermatophilus sp. YIM 151500]|uniref:DUF1059 domain-containing protein n=1 Tax=Geodermatophilus sp. YIM 151500 TaxID=2984531 RepID=UPI0021E464C3|nr:DUF1059 domain-containing protein [Geodermatophilus sp. YIM 151500]MCV2490741.1 DUF1059 domain-containing protein [Geodermatophilus sp. YIM 151500]
MARKTIDCRRRPSERGCTVVISGEEDEVLELAVAHAVSAHGHTDGPELRDGLRAELRDEGALDLEEGAFVQLVEFRTDDSQRFLALLDEWRERMGAETTARWAVLTADRDRPDVHVQVVAFPDHAAAMRNSEHPVTTEFAKRLHEVADGEPEFRNLDVRAVTRV